MTSYFHVRFTKYRTFQSARRLLTWVNGYEAKRSVNTITKEWCFDRLQEQQTVNSPEMFRPALQSIQLLNDWLAGTLSPGIRLAWGESDHSPPPIDDVKNKRSYTSTPLHTLMWYIGITLLGPWNTWEFTIWRIAQTKHPHFNEPVVWMKYNYLFLQMASTSVSLARRAWLKVHTKGKRNARSVFKVLGPIVNGSECTGFKLC
jgi:hypothetical protein